MAHEPLMIGFFIHILGSRHQTITRLKSKQNETKRQANRLNALAHISKDQKDNKKKKTKNDTREQNVRNAWIERKKNTKKKESGQTYNLSSWRFFSSFFLLNTFCRCSDFVSHLWIFVKQISALHVKIFTVIPLLLDKFHLFHSIPVNKRHSWVSIERFVRRSCKTHIFVRPITVREGFNFYEILSFCFFVLPIFVRCSSMILLILLLKNFQKWWLLPCK